MRNSHHCFHIDKDFDGIGSLYAGKNHQLREGINYRELGVSSTLDAYWNFWKKDHHPRGWTKEDLWIAMNDTQQYRMLNIWISLTPGVIEQSPLAFLDILSEHDERWKEKLRTQFMKFKASNDNMLVDTITVMEGKVSDFARIIWKPDMKFGEVSIFPTFLIPHSAVTLIDEDGNLSASTARTSAELRILLMDRNLQKKHLV